jgi:hypothetical protein
VKNAVRLLVTGAIVAVAIVPWAVAWSSLPDPIASHWGLGATPDGHMPRFASFVVLTGLALMFAASAAVTARHEGAIMRIGSAGPGMAFGGASIAIVSLAVVVANHNAGSWEHARLPNGWLAAALVGGAAIAAIVSWTQPKRTQPASTPLPATTVGATEKLAWVGSARTPVSLVVAAVAVAVGVVLIVAASPLAGGVVIATAFLAGTFSSVQVLVGTSGVRMHGALGLPRIAVPLARIASAEAIDVKPAEWSGWGYRGSLRVFGRAAWVVRGGEGLKLNLRDDKVFVVTVDDASEAAAVVNGLVARRA